MIHSPDSDDSPCFDMKSSAFAPHPECIPSSLSDLQQHLESRGIDVKTWGSHGAKDVEDLFQELRLGESTLIEHNGALVRATTASKIRIISHDPVGGTFQLFEDRQVFKDGAVRRRPTAWAVWEKCTAAENPYDAALRGLKEELKLANQQLTSQGAETILEPAMDYPSLPTLITNHSYTLSIPHGDRAPSYIEEQEKKSTYFTWRLVSTPWHERSQELMRSPVAELRDLLMVRAEQYHVLYSNSAAGDAVPALVLAESFTGGIIGQALSSFDGSSRYLRGALYPSPVCFERAQARTNSRFEDAAAFLEHDVKKFTDTHQLLNKILISNYAVVNLPYGIDLYLSAHGKGEAIHLEFAESRGEAESEQIERARLVASIISLESGLNSEPHQDPSHRWSATDTLTDYVAEVRSANLSFWSRLEEAAKLDGERIVIGESFTFGKLARLLASDHHKARAFTAFGWYDRNWKIAAGVPADLVTDQLIATPETVKQGAIGLLTNIDPQATISLATSGWANFGSGDCADKFSVAAAISASHGPLVRTIEFEVGASRNHVRDFWRRDLTRELGVTATLCVLAQILAERGGDTRCCEIADELSTVLQSYAVG
jgi:nicotinamide mononucleotide (NMN) deamidase PncC